MAFWFVRTGKYGEQEEGILQNNVVSIGWNALPDLSKIKNKEELATLYTQTLGAQKPARLQTMAAQIWSFIAKINKGDLVAIPLKLKSEIIIGEVTGDYEYRQIHPNLVHIRSIKRLRTIPRSQFDQDILFSLNASRTVGRVRSVDAEKRVRNMVIHGKSSFVNDNDDSADLPGNDLEQYAKDQITKYLEQKFTGHDLARLINEILVASGYFTKVSPPGPDGGVDILAGSGALGFESPRICVQVKSSKDPVDVRIVRELAGVVKHFDADYGLLAAWGGVTNPAHKEMSSSFFSTRLWDQGKIVDEVIKNYEKFSEDIKAELPLKNIWALVEDSD